MLKTYAVSLDSEIQTSNAQFTVSQNDLNIVEVTITVMQDGSPIDLTDTLPRIAVKKPSGLCVIQDGTLVDAINGVFKATLLTQAYIEVGTHTAEVYVYKNVGTQCLVTGTFTYNSKASLLNDSSVESSNAMQSINDALLNYDKKPLLLTAPPAIDPEYVGQMALDQTAKISYIATGSTLNDWVQIGTGTGSGGSSVTLQDNLTTTTTGSALDAHQGYALDQKKADKTYVDNGDNYIMNTWGNGKVNNTKGVAGIWTGTQAEYDAITTKDSQTIYFIVG